MSKAKGIHYVFVHGWGCDSRIWKKLASHFPKSYTHCLELGFVGPQDRYEHPDIPSDSKIVYITHSLGTLWSIKKKIQDIDALISINGFYNFEQFASKASLRAMRQALKYRPIHQMRDFWDKCGVTEEHNGPFNVYRLQEGLEWLSTINATKELRSFAGPVLSLAGQYDPILNPKQMRIAWSGYNTQFYPDGGHIMPWTHSDWCAQKIKTFINGLRLEK